MSTPQDTAITVRDYHFDLPPERVRDWDGGNTSTTLFYNALSLLFPEGERFFIRSVRELSSCVRDPQLAVDVKAFTAQEAFHTREHVEYNEALRAAGYDVDGIEARVRSMLAYATKRLGAIELLAATAALEHFTALLAHEVSSPGERYLRNAAAPFRRLWLWHALEEMEHKAVAFDVFRVAAGRLAYPLRVFVMLTTTVFFTWHITQNLRSMVRTDRGGLGAWLGLAWTLAVRPGIVPRLVLPYLRYYAPGFHPSQIDDRLAQVKARAAIAYS